MQPFVPTKATFYQLSLVTLYGFGGLAWLIVEFGYDYTFARVLVDGLAGYQQLLLGFGYGIVTGLIAAFIVRRPFFRSSKLRFVQLTQNLDLTVHDILFFSLCAGIGEELLFRAAIQPLIGIWPAAIIFVALHGYLNPKDLRMSVYGVYMVLVAAGFGYLYEMAGIWAAVSAHFIIDVILFRLLKNEAGDEGKRAE